MDLSGTQGELPLPMHAAASPYLGLHHDHHHHGGGGMNGRHMSPPTPQASGEDSKAVVPSGGGGGGGARYRECLKNHAAAIGGSATDGCGEFMPAGEEGSLDALRCSACGCHRNFHRKELDYPSAAAGSAPHHHHHHLMLGGGGALSPLAAHHRGGHHHHHLLVAALPPPTRMVMPLSAMQTSESDDAAGARPGAPGSAAAARKRFRTKFTAEQKARMLGFAEEVGWRLQKLEDAVVQRFCQEVGVKRRVLKVWMHNNKHTLARRHLHPAAADDGSAPPHPEPGGAAPSPSSPQQLRLE
ncbi:zinc-finger homeodomain protein 3-like [Oryza brachyantha]|uniref:zinc-finger homeodomain protein 3-like n=1 Tax=Oryza brachyantha TaxID=4533 RepID=UPI001ADB0909|nr:zinc-finger homeodomain protein 3-like [Oryza brachyantha]XP_040385137.1 zinc-finger homeodomain protein 3-like [Oryza brachyantha]